MLHKPISEYIFQFFEKHSMCIFLIQHNKSKGIIAKNTLNAARVIGSKLSEAILILKKEEPQIKPRKVSNSTSNLLGSLITAINNCKDVKNA